MAKKLQNIKITWISLVAKPANGREFVYKSADTVENGYAKLIEVKKTDDDKYLIYGVVYIPEEKDSQGEFATAEEIEKACHQFSEQLRQWAVDAEHEQNTIGSVVVENFILKGEHPQFPDVKEGSWCVVIKVKDVDVWKAVKEGKFTGLSMYGVAEKVEVEKSASDEDDDTFYKKFKGVMRRIFKEETFETIEKGEDMDAKEIAKIVSESVAAALKPVNDRLDKIEKSAKEPDPAPGAVTGNPETEALKKEVADLRDEIKKFDEKPGRKSGNQDIVEKSEGSEGLDLDVF